MDIIKDAFQVNKQALLKTFKSLKQNPVIILILFLIVVLKILANALIIGFSMMISIPILPGIISYLVEIFFLSLMVASLQPVINGEKLNVNYILSDARDYFNPIMSISFVFWLVEMVVNFVSGPFASVGSLFMIVSLVIFALRSPMIETVYIGRETSMEGFMSIVDFLKNNIVQWIPVLALFVLVSFYSNIINAMTLLYFNIPVIIMGLLILLAFAILYIYKGHLYKILYNSSVRKRQFMGVFDNDN